MDIYSKAADRIRHWLRQIGHAFRARGWSLVAALLFVIATVVSLTRHSSVESNTGTGSALPRYLTAGDSQQAPETADTELVTYEISDPSKIETRLAYVSGRLETSLFDEGQRSGLSDAQILKLIEIFGWDIDFALNIRPGDSFSVVFEEKYWLGQKIGDGPILAAEFVNRSTPYYAFGFRDGKGVTSYYDLAGFTKRKRFLRTPIEFSRVSSRYTDKATRYHPILKKWTAHRGVDYAAPNGTPIRATAPGRVLLMEPNGGYGNAVIVKHDSTYETLYAHLARYATNIRLGSFVEQGQIIGYVGQTGLATGPHLHYEFHVNNQHRDPLRLKFEGAPIADDQRQAFFAQIQPLITQLSAIADRSIAMNQ